MASSLQIKFDSSKEADYTFKEWKEFRRNRVEVYKDHEYFSEAGNLQRKGIRIPLDRWVFGMMHEEHIYDFLDEKGKVEDITGFIRVIRESGLKMISEGLREEKLIFDLETVFVAFCEFALKNNLELHYQG